MNNIGLPSHLNNIRHWVEWSWLFPCCRGSCYLLRLGVRCECKLSHRHIYYLGSRFSRLHLNGFAAYAFCGAAFARKLAPSAVGSCSVDLLGASPAALGRLSAAVGAVVRQVDPVCWRSFFWCWHWLFRYPLSSFLPQLFLLAGASCYPIAFGSELGWRLGGPNELWNCCIISIFLRLVVASAWLRRPLMPVSLLATALLT